MPRKNKTISMSNKSQLLARAMEEEKKKEEAAIEGLGALFG
jgi:hypothetical protein